VLYLREFLLYLGNVVAVRIQKLRLMFLNDVLHLLVHLIDHLVEIFVCFKHWVTRVSRKESAFV
jgi:hypothetical protein